VKPWVRHLIVFLVSVVVVASVATPLLLSLWPAFILNNAHKAISAGLASGLSIPDNTLYTVPDLASPETAHGNKWILGGNQDGLYTVGYLDLSDGALMLTISDMGSRYHNVELIAPRTGVVIANLKAAGEYVIVRAGASVMQSASGARVIHAPGKQVLVAGRTLVENSADLPAARFTPQGTPNSLQRSGASHLPTSRNLAGDQLQRDRRVLAFADGELRGHGLEPFEE
jgi:hypothetical protein